MKEYLKLLLMNPASSARAERRYNNLRGLKTWLRNRICQTRLNHSLVELLCRAAINSHGHFIDGTLRN